MLKTDRNLYTGMLLIMIAGTFLSSQLFFLLSIVYYFVLLMKSKFKVMVPNAPEIKLYIFVILYGTLLGLVLYSTRNVLRDLYYFLPTVLWIFIGTALSFLEKDYDIFKTLFIYGAFISLKTVVLFFIRFSFDFASLRSVFGMNVYDVGFILPIAIDYMFLHNKIYISKRIDRLIVILMTLQILLSLGRIAIIQPILMVAVLIAMESKEATNKKSLRKIAILLMVIVLLLFVIFYIMPSNIKNPLIDKFMDSFKEVNSSQMISSTAEAMSHWRAYEIQASKMQWKSMWPLTQIFGQGVGKGIEIDYIPYNWKNVVENGEIPLLHNGFYTMLIKGGIVGVGALLWLFIGNIRKGFSLSKTEDFKQYGFVLVGLSVAAIANTYVVRGPIQQGSFLIWAVLVGWINSICRRSYRNVRKL